MNNIIKKLFAMTLAVIMVLSMLPLSTFAAETTDPHLLKYYDHKNIGREFGEEYYDEAAGISSDRFTGENLNGSTGGGLKVYTSGMVCLGTLPAESIKYDGVYRDYEIALNIPSDVSGNFIYFTDSWVFRAEPLIDDIKALAGRNDVTLVMTMKVTGSVASADFCVASMKLVESCDAYQVAGRCSKCGADIAVDADAHIVTYGAGNFGGGGSCVTVTDADAYNGEAKKYSGVKLDFDALYVRRYAPSESNTDNRNITLGSVPAIDLVADGQYHTYSIETTLPSDLDTNGNMVYFTNGSTIQNGSMAASLKGFAGKKVTITFSMKIDGDITKTSTDGATVYVDKMEIVESCDNYISADGTYCTKCHASMHTSCEGSWDAGVVTAPSCTEGGYTTYTCTVCGDTYTADETDALGHSVEDACVGGTCTVCGETVEAAHTLEYVAAVVPANCQQTGHDEYWYCSDCEGYFGQNPDGTYYQTNPAWLNYTGDHVRPEGVADCAIVACEICGEDSYGTAACDRGDAPACQDATCVNCGGEMWGEGHSYGYDEDWNPLTPFCQPGDCIYCGEHFEYLYECENGSYAPCSVDGECVYGCGKQYPATGEHAVDNPCEGGLCWQCWTEIEGTGHSYNDYTVIQWPSPKQDAIVLWSCEDCGSTKQETIAAPELPTAAVAEIENEELTFALNFNADDPDELQLIAYGHWYADFVLTVNKDVTFNANGEADGYLGGQFDGYGENWLYVPFGDDVSLTANESLKIMEYAAEMLGQEGLKLTYNDVYNDVKDFDCGVFFDNEFLRANPDLEVTLELRMFNPEDESESYVIGETYVFTYEAPDWPTATATEIEKDDLTFAMSFVADPVTDEQLAYYGEWYADFVLTVSETATFHADGSADGYLAGSYQAWQNGNWVYVPFDESVTLNANESLKIMAYAAELLGEPGLKYTYKEVYEVVKDFDCGVFFDNEYLAANPDLVVTLELRMYNPDDETESYVIGETYVFTNTIVAQNVETGKVYNDVNVALNDAQAGETVILLKSVDGYKSVTVFEDITFDLNGFSLTAKYFSSFGNTVDNSESNEGLLVCDHVLMEEANAQLPVNTADGYKFYRIYRDSASSVNGIQSGFSGDKFAFVANFEAAALNDLLAGKDASDVKVMVKITWTSEDGMARTQLCEYSDELVADFLNSYNATSGRYGKQLFLTLNGEYSDLSFQAYVTSETGVAIYGAIKEK